MSGTLGALVRANVRYWTTVAPAVRAQLALWERRALQIEDPTQRALALGKLRDERFNPRLAATLATLAPRARRRETAEAIVALQLAYDYLDALGEQDTPEGQELPYGALGEAFRPADGGEAGDTRAREGDYLRELIATVRERVARMPAAAAVTERALRAAERCEEAQARCHAIRDGGRELGELERWARAQASSTGLGWREWLAGAQASVLCLHALIAAAADPCTSEADAGALDELYLRIGAIAMLDSVVDRAEDAATGALDYQALYESGEEMGLRLAAVARGAIEDAGRVRHGAHHVVTLAGIVAYYSSAPAAREPCARAAFECLPPALGAIEGPTLVVMRTWRLSERVTKAMTLSSQKVKTTHRGGRRGVLGT